MAALNYYRRYSGDYLRKTSRLSMVEHGAYGLLLDYYYSEERPLPLDHDEIYTMVRAMRPQERAAVDKVLKLFFERRGGGYHNARCDEEIEKAQPAIKAAKENGKKRGGRTNPTGKPVGMPPGKPVGSANEPTGIEAGLHPPTSNLQPPAFDPPTSNRQPPKKSVARKRASTKTPLPENFTVSERVRQWADKKGFSQLDEHLEHFAMQCQARGYAYADWDAAFMKAITADWARLRNGTGHANKEAFDQAEREIFGESDERDITHDADRI